MNVPSRGTDSDKSVALVTGSGRGIGKYIAQQLVARGFEVVGCSRTPADWADERYRHICADVGDEHQVKNLLSEVSARFGRLHVAVNNAGIASMNHSLLTPASTLDRIMSVNFRGTFLVSRESAKLMQRGRYGRIINLTSIAVPMNLEGESIYAASKGAVENLTKVMSRELAGMGITVNAIGPSPIETDLIRNVPKNSIQAIVSRLAIKRLGQPEDVMNVLEFFIRPESGYVTGQVIYLGGP
jgi:3-oxoacyl-[acyl-carrier protein] reductase